MLVGVAMEMVVGVAVEMVGMTVEPMVGVAILFVWYVSPSNAVTALPLTLGRLRNCWELTMNGIRISNVPHHLLPNSGRGSTRHLLAYLRAQLRHCVPYNRMKLMVVGLQGRGKTTLLSVLRTPNSPLPENVSTVGVVVNDWVVSPPVGNTRKRNAQQKVRHQIINILYGAHQTNSSVQLF